MTGTVMEIRYAKGAGQRTLGLDKSTKDALADYCRRRWPLHTAKLAAREWDLTTDEARGVIAARASQTTTDRIFKRGGLLLALQILEEVTGERLADIIRDLRGAHEERTFLLGELVRGAGPDPAAGGARRAAGDPRRSGEPAVRRRRHG